MKLELSKIGKKLVKYADEHDGYCDDMDESHELYEYHSRVKQSSDDFWYCLTNGYIDYKLILDEESIIRVEQAIKTLSELDDIVTKTGFEL